MPSALTDTLQVNQEILHQYQSNSQFDYQKELLKVDVDLWQQIKDWIREYIDRLSRGSFYDDNRLWIWTFLGLVMIGLLFAYLWTHHPQLFGREGKNKLDYEEAQDIIYGIDFASQIKEAWQREDYHEVVRLNYLHALKRLSDYCKIDWRIYKTPTQYTREITTEEFKRLTLLFLRVRYGNYPVDKYLAEEVEQLKQSVTVGCLEGGQV